MLSCSLCFYSIYLKIHISPIYFVKFLYSILFTSISLHTFLVTTVIQMQLFFRENAQFALYFDKNIMSAFSLSLYIVLYNKLFNIYLWLDHHFRHYRNYTRLRAVPESLSPT